MTEEWKGVTGWDDRYEVSNLGRARSLETRQQNPLTGGESIIPGRILKGAINQGGYRKITLSRNGVQKTLLIHQAVAREFIPNPDNLPLVLHGPNGKQDNSVSNLRWGTNSDNMHDKRRDGTDHMLNRTHCPQDHEYTGENTSYSGGARRCIKCNRDKSIRRYWRLRNAELNRRKELGLPERIAVPRCEHCGRFLGKKHKCKEKL